MRGLELIIWLEGQWEALKNEPDGKKRQLDKQTDGHGDSMTKSAQWADAMKIWFSEDIAGKGWMHTLCLMNIFSLNNYQECQPAMLQMCQDKKIMKIFLVNNFQECQPEVLQICQEEKIFMLSMFKDQLRTFKLQGIPKYWSFHGTNPVLWHLCLIFAEYRLTDLVYKGLFQKKLGY